MTGHFCLFILVDHISEVVSVLLILPHLFFHIVLFVLLWRLVLVWFVHAFGCLVNMYSFIDVYKLITICILVLVFRQCCSYVLSFFLILLLCLLNTAVHRCYRQLFRTVASLCLFPGILSSVLGYCPLCLIVGVGFILFA